MNEKSHKGNRVRKLLAVLIAFLIWFYVGNIENPIITKTLQVPIRLINISDELHALSYEEQLTLVIEGRSKRVQSITADDFKAEVDLSKASIGENTLQVLVSSPSGIKILKQQPNQVSVELRRLDEKEVLVKYHYHGQLKSGLKVEGEPRLSVNKVKVYGSREIVSQVNFAAIDIDLETLKESVVIKRPLIFYDDVGNIIASRALKASSSEIEASINVVSEKIKKVPVRLNLESTLPEGYKIDNISYNVKEVSLYGDEKTLENTKEIFTKPIVFDTFKTSQKLTVDLDIPEGLKLSSPEINSIVVDILLSSYKNDLETIVLPINVIGDSKFSKVQMASEIVEVSYHEGKKPTEAQIDISNLTYGKHEVLVTINGNGTLKTNKVMVTIE